ncbi:hypothetical protein J2X45_001081 [Caulobacter sp. BE264]|uniref:hypothetical protein n=1 Tax=Caulobacter sp. BE264 TaxID=2817724 RepID=UPI002859FF54|nr:hypothetical protein [Caulobacter sp. BE264]MDR7230000.1 hypothetical protein [Caulobacter sp. BE264]
MGLGQFAAAFFFRPLGWCWKHLWQDKVPLIWNIAVVIIAAWGSYSIAPAINEKVERQKIQSEYVSQNLKDINNLIADFYVAVQKVNSSKGEISKLDLEKCDEIATKLHWKSIEVSAILRDRDDQKLMLSFQRKLNDVQKAIPEVRQKDGSRKLSAALTDFSATGVQVIGAVARRAEIRE